MAAHRGHAGVVTSRVVAMAIRETSSYRSIGAALDLHHSVVEPWANESAPAAFTLRDLVASFHRGERAFAVRVVDHLRALFTDEAEEPAPPSRVGNAISHAAGMVAGLALRIEADGHVDPQEEQEFLDALRAAESIIVTARRAREAVRR